MYMKKEKTVPVFFASDENYLPFLGVALASLKAHCDKDRRYAVHVLTSGTLEEKAQCIEEMQTQNLSVQFHDVSKHLKRIVKDLHCRDYYTPAIFYRLFIPDLFPEYDKAVYLDCDVVLQADVAHFFDVDLGDNLLGAVADQVVAATREFRAYTRKALGIEPNRYFNSGVLSMNLKALRAMGFYRAFCDMLHSYRFIVAPDQDCLNIICKDKVYYFEKEWNYMPIMGICDTALKLVHYNLSLKPWHYDDIAHGKLFWEYAKETVFYEEIRLHRSCFTAEQAKRDAESGAKLIAMANAEANGDNNYLKSLRKKQTKEKTKNKGGRYAFNTNYDGAVAAYSKN